MAKVKVFLSFEFDGDRDIYRNFFAQADRGDSCHEIEDYSLNEAYRPHDNSWLKKARSQISRLGHRDCCFGTGYTQRSGG